MSRRLPDAPLAHPNPEEHRRQIAQRANASLPRNGTQPMTQPLVLAAFAIAELPDASLWQWGTVVVTDDVGGSIPAFSDGTDWRRVSDRAVVSLT